jgi:hypothetical protein
VVPQAGLFSAALTAFVVDSKQDLTPNPADEAVYYLRQHSAILSQISVQLSSIAPQVSIPSTPPPPFPAFNPSTSDVLVNAFWFMALAFSLLAALLAILVQQWVRNYMHVFQRYSDPLKSSRLRQYLYEGCEGWYMPKVADAVPICLHLSLFLFFAGLGDLLLHINTTVAIIAITPIEICSLLYVLTTVVPIIYPQSPYQNSFSGIIWYLFQKLRGRRFRDRGPDGGVKPVSAKMAQGQMQLAMEEKEERKDRDVRAIRWLIDNLTEDAEMEQFVMAIPGSFSTDWGVDVWKRVGERDKSDKGSQNELAEGPLTDMTVSTEQAGPRVSRRSYSGRIYRISRPIIHLIKKFTPRYSPTNASTHTPVTHSDTAAAHIQGEDVVLELSKRVTRTLETCRSRQFLANDDIENKLWRRRTRACIETVASLVFCANAELYWLGDTLNLLGDVGTSEKPQELSLAGTGQFFVMCWTCLSLAVVRNFLARSQSIMSDNVTKGVELLARQDDTGDNNPPTNAQKIDETLQGAKWCLQGLCEALHQTEDLTEEVEEILRSHESEISELEQIDREADSLLEVDLHIHRQRFILFRQVVSQFPGVLYDVDDDHPIPFSRLAELFDDTRKIQFIPPRQILKSMCSPAATLRNILEGQGDADAYKDLLNNLKIFSSRWTRWRGDEIQRQLWRMQDLRDGGGLGFTVELFFLALDQLLSTSSSKESHSVLYMGAFRTITSDWSKHKHSLGTQNLLLYIAYSRFLQFEYDYPAYIVDKFLELLGNYFEGQTRSRIDEVVQQLTSLHIMSGFRFWDRTLEVIGARVE